MNGSLNQLPPKQVLALALAEKARRQQFKRAQEEASAAQSRAQLPPQLTPLGYAAHTSLLDRVDHPYSDLLRPSRYKIYYGGRDSAKSWSIAEALIKLTAARPLRVLCTREFQTSIKDSVHQLLRNTIYRLGLQDWFDITNTSIRSRAGGEFIFKGLHNNVQEIKSTEGVDIVWVEEAHNTADESWRILIPTIRKPGSEVWISFNVTDENAPTHQRFVVNPPPEAKVIHLVNFDQNPFLSEESKREIEWLKQTDYHAYEHVYLGLALKISDAVIFGGRYRVEGFDDSLAKKADRLFTGMDHGFAIDPYAFTRSFVYEERLYVQYEAFGVGREFAGKLQPLLDHNGNVVRQMGELEQLAREIPGIESHPIKADNARPETISFLRGLGYNISAAEKWKGSVEDGIAHLKGFTEIIIHERCKHMQQEARLYSFKRDRITGEILPEIVDKNNHGWDSIRYSLDGYIQRRTGANIWAKLGQQFKRSGGLIQQR